MRFKNVWYASETRARSRFKFLVFDDTGVIDVYEDETVFRGRKTRIQIMSVVGPRPRSQSLPSTAYFIVNLAVLPVHVFFLNALQVGLLPWLPLLILGTNALAAGAALGTRWVIVRGRMDDGSVVQCYLADGSALGWGGVLGGTRRLHRYLRNHLPPTAPR